MRLFFRSIRTKLTAWFLIMSLAPLLVSSIFTYNQSSEKLTEKERESMRSLVDSKAQGMNEWLSRQKAVIELSAKTDNLVSGDAERINPYL